MTNAKHTPGPWEVGDLDNAGQLIVRQQHIEVCTCWHHSVGSIEREMEANARLIAAAPELLGSAKLVLAVYDQGLSGYQVTRSIEAIREAVAKAEGR